MEDDLVVSDETDGWVQVDTEEGLGWVSTEFVSLHTEFVEAESKEEEEKRLAKEKQEREKARAAAAAKAAGSSKSSSGSAPQLPIQPAETARWVLKLPTTHYSSLVTLTYTAGPA